MFANMTEERPVKEEFAPEVELLFREKNRRYQRLDYIYRRAVRLLHAFVGDLRNYFSADQPALNQIPDSSHHRNRYRLILGHYFYRADICYPARQITDCGTESF
jgi:hypothetical protein